MNTLIYLGMLTASSLAAWLWAKHLYNKVKDEKTTPPSEGIIAKNGMDARGVFSSPELPREEKANATTGSGKASDEEAA